VESPAGEVVAPVGRWYRFSFTVARGFTYGLLRVLGLRGLYHFGRAFATIEWLINYRRRRRFRRQIRPLFRDELPRARRRRACWRLFVNTRCDKLFFLIFDRLPQRVFEERFKWVDVEGLEAALRSGSGAYVAMSHFGAHHIAILMMSLRGHKVAGVRGAEEGPIRRYILDKYTRRYPQFAGIKSFYTSTNPREIFRAFRDGYLVGSASDVARIKNPRMRTVDVRFFGETRPFLVGPLQIALKCGVPIFQGFVVSRPFFRYDMIAIGPLIEPGRDDTAESESPERIAAVMQRYADNIETMLRQHPCHLSRV